MKECTLAKHSLHTSILSNLHELWKFTMMFIIISPTRIWITRLFHKTYLFTTHLYNQTYKKYELWKNNNHYVNHNFTKVSFFIQCTKMQLITLQNFNIQTCFSQFPWVFSLKCWFEDQIISRIHLSLPNAYKLMCFDRNINGNRDVKILECD